MPPNDCPPRLDPAHPVDSILTILTDPAYGWVIPGEALDRDAIEAMRQYCDELLKASEA